MKAYNLPKHKHTSARQEAKALAYSASLLVASAFLLACATSSTLYPINETAEATGRLTENYSYGMSKSTDVTIQLPDGEVLQGQLTLLNKKPDDFGALYKDAGEFIPPKGTPGTGELAGDKGTQMNCEFFRGAAGGEGICKTTNGALYKFRFAN